MYNDANLILEIIDEKISDNNSQVFTGFPARVLEYKDQVCTVKPNVRFRFRDGDTLEVGKISGVPVKFPSGGGVISSYPIKKGDTVWIDCSMVAIDDWVRQYQEVLTPSTRRTHALRDATAYPCIYSMDKRLGVNNDNFETVFHSTDSKGLSTGVISKMTMTPKGDITLEAEEAGSFIKINSDGTITAEDTNGNKISTSGSGVTVDSTSKIVLSNGSEEVVSLLQELAQLLGNPSLTTTKVSGSEVPLTNAASFAQIASRISSLKG